MIIKKHDHSGSPWLYIDRNLAVGAGQRREGGRGRESCVKDESHQFILHYGIMGILSQLERIAIKRVC